MRQRDKVEHLVRQGLPTKLIARQLGLHVSTVLTHKRLAGLSHLKNYESEYYKQQTKIRIEQGMTNKEIAFDLGLKRGTIANYRRLLGLAPARMKFGTIKICPFCNNEFASKVAKRQFCSRTCANLFNGRKKRRGAMIHRDASMMMNDGGQKSMKTWGSYELLTPN